MVLEVGYRGYDPERISQANRKSEPERSRELAALRGSIAK